MRRLLNMYEAPLPRHLLGNVHKKVNRRCYLEKKVCNYCGQDQKITRGFRCLLLTNDVSHRSNIHLKPSSLSFLLLISLPPAHSPQITWHPIISQLLIPFILSNRRNHPLVYPFDSTSIMYIDFPGGAGGKKPACQ